MTKKRTHLDGCLIVGLSIIILIGLFVIYIMISEKVSLKQKYNSSIGPVTEYLENKYVETMIIDDDIMRAKDGYYVLFVSPEDNQEIVFHVDIFSSGEIRDNYIERYNYWDSIAFFNPIVEKYTDNFKCYSTLSWGLDEQEENNNILLEYYQTNKKHLSWYDEDHLDKLARLGISLYGYHDSSAKPDLIEHLLSDLQELDFTIEHVTFYIEDIDKNKTAKAYYYKNIDGKFTEVSSIF